MRRPAARDAPRGMSSPGSRDGGELRQSSVILGADHPLTRAIDAVQKIRRHCLVVCAVFVGGVINLIEGVAWGAALVLGAGVALFCYGIGAAALEARKRDRALDVIADGRESVPIATVQRSRQRLRAPRTQRRMARVIEGVVEQARNPPNPCSRSARPLFAPTVVSVVVEDLLAVCEVLRTERAAARGVALAERLFGDGASAFYGDDSRALREQLRRIQQAMSE